MVVTIEIDVLASKASHCILADHCFSLMGSEPTMLALRSGLTADTQKPGIVRKIWPATDEKDGDFNIKSAATSNSIQN
jgi:hypothetical protein